MGFVGKILYFRISQVQNLVGNRGEVYMFNSFVHCVCAMTIWKYFGHNVLYFVREAAKECRRKKKEYVRCLENRVAVLESQNQALIGELRALKELYLPKQDSQ